MSTIEKALGLLEHFSAAHPEIGLSEFKALTGVDKGTLHRHLTALRNCGYLEQHHATRAYRLGPAIIRLAIVREKTVPLVKTVQSYIDRISNNVQELTHAALPEKKGMSAIYSKDAGSHGTRVSFDEAEILPYHATSSGIAMLAFSSDAFVESVLSDQLQRYTESTATDISDVRALMEKARTSGVASVNQSYESEVVSYATPFFGPDGETMGTIAIATPASRMDATLTAKCTKALITAGQKLSHDIGGQIPPHIASIWAKQLES